MKNMNLQTLRWVGFILTVSCLSAQAATPIQGRVISVADGDTVTVLDSSNRQHKIRLSGIDAPEKKQAFGQRSKQSLSSMVFNQQVRVEWSKTDRYGRIVGKIIVPNGSDANLEQIKRGMAWHYKQYEREQLAEDRATYAQAEEHARQMQVGLWKDEQALPPWEYRHSVRKY